MGRWPHVNWGTVLKVTAVVVVVAVVVAVAATGVGAPLAAGIAGAAGSVAAGTLVDAAGVGLLALGTAAVVEMSHGQPTVPPPSFPEINIGHDGTNNGDPPIHNLSPLGKMIAAALAVAVVGAAQLVMQAEEFVDSPSDESSDVNSEDDPSSTYYDPYTTGFD